MNLIFPPLDNVIDVSSEKCVNFVVIENQRLFTAVLTDISNQMSGICGDAVLSDNSTPVDISKKMEMISSFIPFDINRKTLINKLLKKIEGVMNDENNYLKTKELVAYNTSYLNSIIDNIDFSVDYITDFDLSSILKSVNIKFSTDFSSLGEMLIEYMLNVIKLEGDKCFLLVNLADYLNDEQRNTFCRNVLYNKLSAVIIGARDFEVGNYERKIIIDADLCVI